MYTESDIARTRFGTLLQVPEHNINTISGKLPCHDHLDTPDKAFISLQNKLTIILISFFILILMNYHFSASNLLALPSTIDSQKENLGTC